MFAARRPESGTLSSVPWARRVPVHPPSTCTRRSKPEGRRAYGRCRAPRHRTPTRAYIRIVPSVARRALRGMWRMNPLHTPHCRGTTQASQVRLWRPCGRGACVRTLSVAACRAEIQFTTSVSLTLWYNCERNPATVRCRKRRTVPFKESGIKKPMGTFKVSYVK